MRQKSFEAVTPSGVRFVVRSFTGEDYETLTSDKNVKDGSALDKVCAAVLLELGNKTNFTEKDILQMLSNDRKYILLKARMFTMRFNPEFKFTYEWPAENGIKQSTEQTIIFSDEHFKNRGYFWVEEEIQKLKDAEKALEDNPDDQTLITAVQELKDKYISGSEFPVMFDSYADVWDEETQGVRLKFGYWKDEDGQLEVRYKFITGMEEKKFASIDERAININTTLKIHKPQYKVKINREEVGANSTQWMDLNLKRMDGYDLESLRGDVTKKEGNIDTTIVLKNDNTGAQQKVDLLMTQAFFLPSQAV